MLYVSTRNRNESFTAFRALCEENTPDGGLFVPFQLPQISLQALEGKSFSDGIAQVLNLFFSAGLTGWDVEFCVGRRTVKTKFMNHRLMMAELWHNLDASYAAMEQAIYKKLGGQGSPASWAKVAIRIAVLVGLYSELAAQDAESFDVAVTAGDFSWPMAAWYARKMGLPIGTIVCGCNENGAVWDLIHRGEYATGVALRHTDTPELDVSATMGLERLIYETLGTEEVCRYRDICAKKSLYTLDELQLPQFNVGLFAAVVGSSRVEPVLASIYRTNDYITDPYTAMAYGALQDYRARTGESRLTLLPAERSPFLYGDRVCNAVGIPMQTLKYRVNTP